MDLGDNRLASIHGLEQCKSLLELNLAENRIARIGEMGFGLPRFIPKPVPRRHLPFYLLSRHCYFRWLVRMSPAAETDSGWKPAHQLKGVVDVLWLHIHPFSNACSLLSLPPLPPLPPSPSKDSQLCLQSFATPCGHFCTATNAIEDFHVPN